MGAAATTTAPQVTIYISNVSNESRFPVTQARQGWEQFGKEIGHFVDQRYRWLLDRDIRPGGTIWNATKGR